MYLIYVVGGIFILLGFLKSDTNDWKQCAIVKATPLFPHIRFSSILLGELQITFVHFSSFVLVHQLSFHLLYIWSVNIVLLSRLTYWNLLHMDMK